MPNKYGNIASAPTPQSAPLPGKEAQMQKNDAGGFVFKLDQWKSFERFLILGSEGGTYYVNEKKHTQRAIGIIDACIQADPVRAAEMVADVSVNGRAMKNDPAEFALAQMIKSGDEARRRAYGIFSMVLRTGRTLLEFNILLEQLGVKWGAARRRAFSNWYDSKTPDNLAYHVLKYPSASEWTHRDILRLCHAGGRDENFPLYRYMVGKPYELESLPALVQGWEEMKKATTEKEVIALIEKYKLTWEFVTGQFQGSPAVWQALLPNLPMTALIRNLGRLTSYGLLSGVNDNVKLVRGKLANRDVLRKARVHPLTLLLAWKGYEQNGENRAFKRENALTWTHNKKVSDAIEDAFYLSFESVEPSGKDMMFGMDVSGSMCMGKIQNLPISCAEAVAVLAMVSLKTEKNSIAYGFDRGIRDMGLSKNDNFESALKKVSNVNGGGTDCALPMMYALDNGMNFDQFVVLTDNETWAGGIHPSKALEKYRKKTGINAKLVVVGMTATDVSIADPSDAGMLDVAGFDTSVPSLISKFAQGL